MLDIFIVKRTTKKGKTILNFWRLTAEVHKFFIRHLKGQVIFCPKYLKEPNQKIHLHPNYGGLAHLDRASRRYAGRLWVSDVLKK